MLNSMNVFSGINVAAELEVGNIAYILGISLFDKPDVSIHKTNDQTKEECHAHSRS